MVFRMQFRFHCSSSSSNRLGKLFVPVLGADVILETPGCLLYTRYGGVPFLPPDVCETIDSLPKVAFVSMSYVAERKSVLHKFKLGLSDFCRLGKRAILLFQTDPVDPASLSAADRCSVPVWATGGRLQLSISDFAECVSLALPGAYQAPTDNETSLPISTKARRKRCGNSVIRTGKYLELLLEERTKNTDLAKVPVLLSLAGGEDLEWRLSALRQVDFSISSGVVLDGFCFASGPFVHSDQGTNNAADDVSFPSRTVFEVLPKICQQLPAHLPRFLTGVWQPYDIATAVKCGVDLFDGSFPYRLARSALAWIYPGWLGASKETDDQHLIAFPLDGGSSLSGAAHNMPIQHSCECHACMRHTRLYISHLHIAQEILGPMLLMIHNSHQFYRFFEDLRLAAARDQMDEFILFSKLLCVPHELLVVDKTGPIKPT